MCPSFARERKSRSKKSRTSKAAEMHLTKRFSASGNFSRKSEEMLAETAKCGILYRHRTLLLLVE
jgi:hypothetical protein